MSDEASRDDAALSARIADRSAVVAICGLGYVGLPLARAMLDAGFAVVGFDTDPRKIAGRSRARRRTGCRTWAPASSPA